MQSLPKNFSEKKKKRRNGLKRCPKLVQATQLGNKNNSQPKEKIAVEEKRYWVAIFWHFSLWFLFLLFFPPAASWWWLYRGDKLRSSGIPGNWSAHPSLFPPFFLAFLFSQIIIIAFTAFLFQIKIIASFFLYFGDGEYTGDAGESPVVMRTVMKLAEVGKSS